MVYTVHMVCAVDMVYTADISYTVDIIYTVDIVYTVDMWTWEMRLMRLYYQLLHILTQFCFPAIALNLLIYIHINSTNSNSPPDIAFWEYSFVCAIIIWRLRLST